MDRRSYGKTYLQQGASPERHWIGAHVYKEPIVKAVGVNDNDNPCHWAGFQKRHCRRGIINHIVVLILRRVRLGVLDSKNMLNVHDLHRWSGHTGGIHRAGTYRILIIPVADDQEIVKHLSEAHLGLVPSDG